MCGRFSLDRTADVLEARFKAKLRISNYTPLYNIGPGMPAACIPMDDAEGIFMYHWGLAPQSKEGVARNLINARTETVCSKWPFAKLVKTGRCIVPASGYVEWKAIGKSKIPFLHKVRGQELFSMAGIFEDNGDSRRFTLLTMPAGPIAAGIHDRMPVILENAEAEEWLDGKSDPEKLAKNFLLKKEAALEAFSVSTKLNRSFDNDPKLMEPCSYSIPEQLSLF